MPRLTTALAAGLLACASIAAARTPGPEKPAKPLPIYDSYTLASKELAWKKAAGEQSNRRVFVNFGTNDCRACRVVNDAINDPKFQPHFLRQFVPAFIDVSPGSPNLTLLKEWKIDPKKGLPAIAILDEKGELAEVTRAGELAKEAKKGTEAVQLWIIQRFYPDQQK